MRVKLLNLERESWEIRKYFTIGKIYETEGDGIVDSCYSITSDEGDPGWSLYKSQFEVMGEEEMNKDCYNCKHEKLDADEGNCKGCDYITGIKGWEPKEEIAKLCEDCKHSLENSDTPCYDIVGPCTRKDRWEAKMGGETTKSGDTPGKKYDVDKDRWDLVPFECLKEVIKVYTYGCKKYGEESLEEANWKEVTPKLRYFAAFQRHVTDWRLGEVKDKDTGFYHLAHAIFNLMCLLWHDLKGD